MHFRSVAALAAQACLATAQMATYSPSQDSNIQYSVNIPSASAQSGSGDIFMQIKGPVTGSDARSWIALGQGSGMAGANIFMIYPDSTGKNVTLSPRLGLGFFEPDYNQAAKVELLSGTGIENGIMTANIKCSSCNSWSGGSMSFTNSQSNWIWSSAAYGSIMSDDKSLDVQMHNERDEFTFDLTKATGGSSANPFVTSDTSSSSGSATSSASGSSSTGGSSGSSSGASTGSSSGAYGGAEGASAATYAMLPKIITAHAAVMSLSFLFFYPLGAIIMRVGMGGSTIWIHAACQAFSYLLAIAGMGMGIWQALVLGYLMEPHAIIGLVVVCLLIVQAPLGLIHHVGHKKHGQRTAPSYIHIWLGRALMTLGAINGGLGLQLAGAVITNRAGVIAYGVLAGVIYLGYFALVAGTAGKGKRNAQQASEKRGSGSAHS